MIGLALLVRMATAGALLSPAIARANDRAAEAAGRGRQGSKTTQTSP
jgi:hypothetical protein